MILTTYKEQEISVSEHGVFSTEDPIHSSETLAGIKALIDKDVADKVIEARVNIRLEMLSMDGKPIVITGLRRGTGAFLQTPRQEGYRDDSRPIYADSAGVRAALKQITGLTTRIKMLRDILEAAKLVQGWSTEFKPSSDADYPSKIALLQSEYTRAKKAADAIREEP